MREALEKIAARQAAKKALRLRRLIVIQLNTPGTGRVYKVRGYRRGRRRGRSGIVRAFVTHRASKPGKSPAPNFGILKNSIGIQKINDFKFRVGTNQPKALWLEYGTEDIAPRPFMRPALVKLRNEDD